MGNKVGDNDYEPYAINGVLHAMIKVSKASYLYDDADNIFQSSQYVDV